MSIKTLIVDDSATVRHVVGGILEQASGIEVIGTASDPLFAMKKMAKEWPGVIVLDIEMPRMDGLTFLKKIMLERPTPVVICSTLTTAGSSTALQALSYGAVEVVAKPKVRVKTGLEDSARELIDAVRAAATADVSKLRLSPDTTPAPKLTADAMLSTKKTTTRLIKEKVVGIGTSTGGTQALERILTQLPPQAPPMVIVQHMPETFTRAFAERLNSICAIDVKEAEDGDCLRQGRALIAPGGKHMMLRPPNGADAYVEVKDGPLVSRHRPSVDVLFRSIAKSSGGNALGIIMTGMGDDGAAGLLEMRDAGAETLGQDQQTCVVYGMPAVAMKRGGVKREVSLQAIAQEIVDFAG